jgi:lantibiotic modifying enzyme
MASNVQKVMELIDTLTPDEKKLIYKKMNDEINGKLLDFLDTVNERAAKFPISMNEITREVEEVRSNNHGKA